MFPKSFSRDIYYVISCLCKPYNFFAKLNEEIWISTPYPDLFQPLAQYLFRVAYELTQMLDFSFGHLCLVPLYAIEAGLLTIIIKGKGLPTQKPKGRIIVRLQKPIIPLLSSSYFSRYPSAGRSLKRLQLNQNSDSSITTRISYFMQPPQELKSSSNKSVKTLLIKYKVRTQHKRSNRTTSNKPLKSFLSAPESKKVGYNSFLKGYTTKFTFDIPGQSASY